jgi:hypothetical protein
MTGQVSAGHLVNYIGKNIKRQVWIVLSLSVTTYLAPGKYKLHLTVKIKTRRASKRMTSASPPAVDQTLQADTGFVSLA